MIKWRKAWLKAADWKLLLRRRVNCDTLELVFRHINTIEWPESGIQGKVCEAALVASVLPHMLFV